MSVARYILMLALLLAATPVLRSEPPERERKSEPPKQRSRQGDKNREGAKKLSPQERESKRKEIKARLEKRLAGLRAKDDKGDLTQEEKRDLKRCEQILKRFEQSNATPPSGKGSKPEKRDDEKGRTCEHD